MWLKCFRKTSMRLRNKNTPNNNDQGLENEFH